MSYQPRDIKAGAYTHLNFSFASIDPITFEVVPADPGDWELYSQLTDLESRDANLQVYIAIRGWDFTEPSKSARNTFSDLVASDNKQRTFFASVISFRSMYNFDGVHIDWEYPGADGRSGRPEDFVNFPIFMDSLKSALATSSGERDGLSLSLPVSYWYLQHFDIAKLPYTGKNWTQPWLNSHTNLTKITDYLVLLWRKDIKPGKVTLGLASYSRTFELVDPSCISAGGSCYFQSGGPPGRCSHSVETLIGAEVDETLNSTGIQPELDSSAAVKIFSHESSWIRYDDEDTFKVKVQFARSQCLGGVMVWAVSQDSGTKYTSQLQSATGYASNALQYNVRNGLVLEKSVVETFINRPQCCWTGCGEVCGTGYVGVYRSDTDRHSEKELMMDETDCKDGTHHTLCRPEHVKQPTCGWYSFWNGQCRGTCPDGFTEMGGSMNACHLSRPQVACCKMEESISTKLYDKCKWEGNDLYNICTKQDSDMCKSGRAPEVASLSGSGGFSCLPDDKKALYCCGAPTPYEKWENCYWQNPEQDSSGYCQPPCPAPEVRISMEAKPNGCNSGGRAYCCSSVYKTEPSDDE